MVPGAIVDRTGPSSYTVKLGNGKNIRRHIDQLRVRSTCTPSTETYTDTTTEDFEQFQDYQLRELPNQVLTQTQWRELMYLTEEEMWYLDQFMFSLWFHMHLPLFSPNTCDISVSVFFPYMVVLFSV